VTTEGNTVGSLSETQRSLIVGTLLGDGAMRCKVNALIEINHSAEQRAYVDWKHQQLAELVGTPPKPRNGRGGRVAYRFTTLSRPELTPYFRAFYPNGKKVVPAVTLTPLALAVWFMDDGSKRHRALYLNTQQFDLEDQLRLLEMLETQFGIHATLNREKTYYRIRIAVRSVSQFVELIRPHLLNTFEYKIPA
jgi:recombination protein RecA